MITEIAWIGHDNTIDLLLMSDGAAVALDAVTRMTLEFGTTTIDSAVDSGAFDWATGTTGKVVIALGALEGLEAGVYTAKLTVYDPTNDDGVVWGEFKLVLR